MALPDRVIQRGQVWRYSYVDGRRPTLRKVTRVFDKRMSVPKVCTRSLTCTYSRRNVTHVEYVVLQSDGWAQSGEKGCVTLQFFLEALNIGNGHVLVELLGPKWQKALERRLGPKWQKAAVRADFRRLWARAAGRVNEYLGARWRAAKRRH